MKRVRVATVVPVALAVLLVALLATSAWFWRRDQRGEDESAAALSAGRAAAVLFFSLDHDHPGANVDRLLSRSTGSFEKEYAERRSALVAQVRSKQLTVRASVPGSGAAVEFYSPERAQVLVAVDATTTVPGGRTEKSAYRTRVVLTHDGDRWLVAGLEQVG